MARISYADIDAPETRPLVDRMLASRGSILHLYRMLLHSPPVAEGWLDYLTAIRQGTTIEDSIRELVILRIAALNGADYERNQHQPIARAAGLPEDKLVALVAGDDRQAFSTREQAVLAFTDAMTRDIRVPEAVWSDMRACFDERAVVELVATISAYNMVSRFIVALDIQSEDALEGHRSFGS